MARYLTAFLPPDEEPEEAPLYMPPQAPWRALVGNASPAEAPGGTAEQYAQAAQQERANGNVDAAARLTVKATETKTAEDAAQGTPEPTTPLAPVSTTSSVAQADTGKLPDAQGTHGTSQYPWSWAVRKGGAPAPEAAGDIRAMERPELYNPLEQPPAYKEPDKGVSFFALALDALLNKGRNAGRLVGQLADNDEAYINYARKVRAAKDAAALEASKRRGMETPEERAYREERLAIARENARLRGEQIEAQKAGVATRAEKQAYDLDPSHKIANRVRANLYAQGVQSGSLDGLSLDAMKSANNSALKNLVEQAQSTEMARVAAEKAKAQAVATEGSKIRVAEGISDATQDNKIALAEAQAGIQAGAAEERAALDEEKAIGAERRKRMVAREKERATLTSILERLKKRDPTDALPKQGHFIDRGLVTFKADVLGGTGMNEEDSLLDNDLTTAGLQAYITEANNAPNSEREQDNAGRKFRGDGTVGGAIAAIEKHLAKSEAAESSLREQEDAGRIQPQRRKPARRRPARPAAAPETTYTPPAEINDSDLDDL